MLQRLTETIRPLSGVDKTTSFEYNSNGDLTGVTDAKGNAIEFTYNEAGNISRINYADGSYETYEYDSVGNIRAHTDGRGRKTEYTWDGDGRLSQVTQADGNTTTFHYQNDGQLKRRVDHFNTAGRLDTITDYNYDNAGRLTGVFCKDASGKRLYQHKFTYDKASDLTHFKDVNCVKYGEGYKYGGANVIGKTSGVKYGHNYKYGQNAKYGAGNVGLKYGETYLGNPGNIPSETNSPQTGAKALTATPPVEGSSTDISGRLKYGMGSKESTYTYDNYARMDEYTDFFGDVYRYGYDRFGRLALIQYPNKIQTTYDYEVTGRLHKIRHKKGSTTLRSFVYQYDGNSNITKITNEDGSYTNYTYDDWNRLTKEEKKNSMGATLYKIEYEYDDVGNIIEKSKTIGSCYPETTSYTYDDFNKLTAITYPDTSTESLTYDGSGNLTRKQKSTGETTSYQWNDQGMLIKVILPSGEPVEYEYDGFKRLVGRKGTNGYERYNQAGWTITEEINPDGTITYNTGHSSNRGGQSKYYMHDHLGSTSLVADKDGNIQKSLCYTAYGEMVNEKGEAINNLSIKDFPNLFIGGYGVRNDAKTKLNYMRFRWYDAGLGRFISVDPIKSVNNYGYAIGNPVTLIDPMGLREEAEGPGGVIAVWPNLNYPLPNYPINNPHIPQINEVLYNIYFLYKPPGGEFWSSTFWCTDWQYLFLTNYRRNNLDMYMIDKKNKTVLEYIKKKTGAHAVIPYRSQKKDSSHVYIYLRFLFNKCKNGQQYTEEIWFLTETNVPIGPAEFVNDLRQFSSSIY